MIEWKIATVVNILANYREQDVQEVAVRFSDGTEAIAIHYGEPVLTLEPGDHVLLNTTAVKLALGTGGVHFVHDVLQRERGSVKEPGNVLQEIKEHLAVEGKEQSISPEHKAPRSSLSAADPGHIMKLRYTSLQRAVLSVEEQASPYHELFTRRLTLEGMPVLVGELHSMLPAAVSRLQQLRRLHPERRTLRVAYVMTDGAALPLAFSKHVRQLKELGWLHGSITCGQAYGGDIEAVNKFTALLAARHVLGADLAIAGPGPGSVGTGTHLGFSGTESAELFHAVHTLQGCPVAIPRISFADGRERHQGISHHTVTVLQDLTLVRVHVPLPILEGEQGELLRLQVRRFGMEGKHDITWHAPVSSRSWQEAFADYTMAISSMGRGLSADPAFFAAIGAAVDSAWSLVVRHR